LDAIVPFPCRFGSIVEREFVRAWHDLYGYSHQDMSAAHVAELMKNKQRIISERGDSFRLVLDQLNIETMSRIACHGSGCRPRAFAWAFDDALSFR